MNRGDIVEVRDFRGRPLRRIMWEALKTSIVVCTESEYENWRLFGQEPKVVGYPLEDVRPFEEKLTKSKL